MPRWSRSAVPCHSFPLPVQWVELLSSLLICSICSLFCIAVVRVFVDPVILAIIFRSIVYDFKLRIVSSSVLSRISRTLRHLTFQPLVLDITSLPQLTLPLLRGPSTKKPHESSPVLVGEASSADVRTHLVSSLERDARPRAKESWPQPRRCHPP